MTFGLFQQTAMAQESTRKALALARKLGVLRPRDLRAAGLRREYAQRLLAHGELGGVFVRRRASGRH